MSGCYGFWLRVRFLSWSGSDVRRLRTEIRLKVLGGVVLKVIG